MTGGRRYLLLVIAGGLSAVAATPAAAQQSDALSIQRADGSVEVVELAGERGFSAVPVGVLEELGWSITQVGDAFAASGPDSLEVAFTSASPFFSWAGELLQLADAPYVAGGETRIPLQFLTDFLPLRLPELYAFDGPSLTLQAADAADWAGSEVSDEVRAALEARAAAEDSVEAPADAGRGEAAPPEPPAKASAPPPDEGPRVVVIDAGHGGGDPGTLGARGLREKDVALGIARIMADLLRREEGVEVYMTRDEDVFVPIWERGELATGWKGERHGIFVSVHANSTPDRRSARGFETYFLSEARNEHERRVEAIENAPLQVQGQSIDPDSEPDLGFILRELRTLDHQHWSSLLAEMVQQEMARFHPGPNRGVKQGVLAVLTNALMPSVLVEVGYLSNEDEGPLLGQPTFQDEAARAIARAVMRFIARYPPGSGTGRDLP